MIRKFTEKHLISTAIRPLSLCFFVSCFLNSSSLFLSVPLVSKVCPSDVYRVWKSGSCLRVDTTLLGFEHMTWLKGRRSYIFKGGGVCVCALSELHHLRTTWTRLERLNKHQTFSNINSVFASSGSTCVWLSFSPVCSSS